MTSTQALGKRVSNAVSAGRRKRTKPLRNIRSMCRDIERRNVNEGQIPGTKIEPQRPLLDTLVLRTAITPPVWRGGAAAILLVYRTQKLVEDLRRAPLVQCGITCASGGGGTGGFFNNT